MTPSLFAEADRVVMIRRIESLQPGAERRWGKMEVAQMLAHCQAPLRIATGVAPRHRQSLAGMLFGRMAIRTMNDDKPIRQNLPTDKSFVVRDARDFETERRALIALVQGFGEGGAAAVSADPHPFFGRLEAREWDALMWKHLDHHLQQFGA